MPIYGLVLFILLFAGQVIAAPQVNPDSLPSFGLLSGYSPVYLLSNKKSSGNSTISGSDFIIKGYYKDYDNEFEASLLNRNYTSQTIEHVFKSRFSLDSKTNSVSFRGSKRISLFTVSGDVEGVQSNSQRIVNGELSVGLKYPEYYLRTLSAEYSSNSVPYNFNASYSTANLLVENQVRFSGFNMVVGLGTDKHFLEYRNSKSYISPTLRGGDVRVANDGKVTSNSFIINYSLESFNFRIDNSNFRVNDKTYFYKEGMQFSYLVIPEIFFEKYGISADYYITPNNSFDFSTSYARIKINSVGELDSWPFTTVLESIFLNRLYYRVNGTAVAKWVDFKYKQQIGKWGIEPSVTYCYIRPEINLDTWESSFLIFGGGAMNKSTLNIKSTGLLLLNLSTHYELFDFSLGLSMNQIIPLFVNKGTTTTSGGTPGPTPAQAASQNKTDGGRWFEIYLKKRI